MKTLILATLIAFTYAFALGQDKSDTIRNIEKKIQFINRDTSYSIVSLINEEFLDTGFLKQPGKGYGQLTGFFKNDTIYKIRMHIGIKLMHNTATTEYYFREGKLIFVYEQEKQGPDIFIDSDGTVDYRIDEPTFEVRYYFDNDKLINTNIKGVRKTMLLPNEDFFDSQSKEGQLFLSSQRYIDLLINKKKR